MILIVVAVLVLGMLVAAFLVDRQDRKNGIRPASPKQISAAIRESKRETRAQLKLMRRGMNQPAPGAGRRSPGVPYLRPDEGPPRRGR